MKKFFYHFFCYTGLILAVITQPAYSETATIQLPFTEDFAQKLDEYKDKSIIETDNELLKYYVTFLLADKLFPEEKINEDMTGFLKRVFPKTNIKKLKILETTIKTVLMVKRRYVYVVDRLKHKIKADSLLPKDTPIVAKDGEYAPADADLQKKTDNNSYQISYLPYKYLEYDPGELGDPVRRRDKNYEEPDQTALDEITLAILELDIKNFYKALKKLPKYNDGTREKIVELENGVTSRLLLATAQPGTLETIDGVLEVLVPQGWYINGDYLNKASLPKFYLTEDNKEDLNIKEYQIFYPIASGVVSNGINRRLWYGSVRFPLRFTRRNTNKGINIKSNFTFMLCQAKTDKCHYVTSQNSLKLAPSDDEAASIHSNFVTLSFAKVPPKRSPNAELKNIYYNKKDGKLTVKFKTDKTFSNVAVMAENAIGTNFSDPQYSINNDEITATFKTTPQTDNWHHNETSEDFSQTEEDIAVTAVFDNIEKLRTVTTPQVLNDTDEMSISQKPNYSKVFLFGLLLNLMPGICYLLLRLMHLLSTSRHPYKILYRYALGSSIGLILWHIYNSHLPWFSIYEQTILLQTCLMLAVSYLMNLLGYMNFDLFRPFKGLLRKGLLLGFISILFAAATPTLLKVTVMNNLTVLPIAQNINSYIIIWLGSLTLLILIYILRNILYKFLNILHYFNFPYMLIFICEILWLIYHTNGFWALMISLVTSALLAGIWYIYPLAITETVKHKHSLQNKTELFLKVQKHSTVIVFVIWLTSIILLKLLTTSQTVSVPNINDTIYQAEQNFKNNRPTLLLLATPQTYYTQRTLRPLIDSGINILYYKVSGQDKNLSHWLNTYKQISPPLNILFNRRHKKGLKLPDKLENLDWPTVLKDY